MKKILIVVLVLAMLLSMTACGSSPKSDFEAGMKAFKSLDSDGIAKYFEGMDEDDIAFDGMEKSSKLITKALKYKVLETGEEVDGVCTIQVEITNVDMGKVAAAAASKLMGNLMDMITKSEEEIMADLDVAFEEAYGENKNELVAKTINVVMIQGEDCWQIKNSTALLSALMGGMGDIEGMFD